MQSTQIYNVMIRNNYDLAIKIFVSYEKTVPKTVAYDGWINEDMKSTSIFLCKQSSKVMQTGDFKEQTAK